jgi:hypothetical protein
MYRLSIGDGSFLVLTKSAILSMFPLGMFCHNAKVG